MLALGGSKVSIYGNFKEKGKCISGVASQESGGLFNFLCCLPVARGNQVYKINKKAAQCTNLFRLK